jgi:hypothetical protein
MKVRPIKPDLKWIAIPTIFRVSRFLDAYLTLWPVRPPLDAIVNYLDMALDSEIDDKTRDILGKAQDASISLINVMDDLLRLTEEEDGSYQPLSETFNLRLTGKSPIDDRVSY